MLTGNLTELISEIEETSLNNLSVFSLNCGKQLRSEEQFLNNLSGQFGALIMRYLLYHLGVDENRIFRWRLENKYIQYRILDYYFPGCMPDTIALSSVLNQSDGVQKARNLFQDGYFLKSTLGDSSFATKTWDKTCLFETLVKQYSKNANYEKYVIQKKLKLVREFRVHTFGRQIIPFLTFRIPATQEKNHHIGAQKFVEDVLMKLPNQIIHDTVIGWDIGLTQTKDFYVIESNFTGFHPEYRRGFQTTGYVDDYQIGPIISAWFNQYFKARYGVYISSIDPAFTVGNPFLKSVEFYNSIFSISTFRAYLTNKEQSLTSVITYIHSYLHLRINLIGYLHLVDFALKYYVITTKENFDLVVALFSKKPKVKVILDADLFNTKQFLVISQLPDSKRFDTCCQYVAKQLKEKYLII